MSMISWPADISAPGSICHSATMPSCMANPHFGITIASILIVSSLAFRMRHRPAPPPDRTGTD